MSTITTYKQEYDVSLDDLINAINEHGSEKVTVVGYYGNNLIKSQTDAYRFMELLPTLNDESIVELIQRIVRTRKHQSLSSFLNINEEQLMDKFSTIIIDRGLKLSCVHDDTSIRTLNLLAENNAVDLYLIEDATNIDIDFVKKYHNELDIFRLQERTIVDEIKDFIEELKEC